MSDEGLKHVLRLSPKCYATVPKSSFSLLLSSLSLEDDRGDGDRASVCSLQ